jgi:hypothetical protein
VVSRDFTGGRRPATITRVDGEDLADDTYVAAPPPVLARAVSAPERWREWWPDLRLTVAQDRGAEGLRWQVTGALSGTAEVWLEPVGDGTVLHFYLRAGLSDRARRQRALAWKRSVHLLKDELERGRAAGTPVRRSRR